MQSVAGGSRTLPSKLNSTSGLADKVAMVVISALAPANRLTSIGQRRNDGLGCEGCNSLSRDCSPEGLVSYGPLDLHAIEQSGAVPRHCLRSQSSRRHR
jgi:hypothetical protein